MHNLQHRQRLRPLGELADAAMDILQADERDEENDATEDSDPENGADKVVEDEVLGLERTGRGGVHGGMGTMEKGGVMGGGRYGGETEE